MKWVDLDCCIYCGESLSLWERTRSHCWNCSELITTTYHEEDE